MRLLNNGRFRMGVLVMVPVVLTGVAWKVQQLQKPISVHYVSNNLSTHVLFTRMNQEVLRHPYARSIRVSWEKEGNHDPMMVESLELDRRKSTLTFDSDFDSWSYSNVDNSGIALLAQTKLADRRTESAPWDALLKQGWISESVSQ